MLVSTTAPRVNNRMALRFDALPYLFQVIIINILPAVDILGMGILVLDHI